jgi:phosphoglycerate kinase
MTKKTIRDINVSGKRVLVRVDFNVPQEHGKIADDTRIVEALPTIQYLLKKNAKIILMSHLGRPKGKVVEKLRLESVGRHLSYLLAEPVITLSDCIGEAVERKVYEMEEGDIILLENLRFHPEEEENDLEFAKKLASLGEIFVNDAFGTAHRAHASTEGITHFLPSVAGFLMEKEIKVLSEIIEKPARPLICLIGGAKISTKIKVIKNLIKKVDRMLLGGALVNTILKAQGQNIGRSFSEEEMIPEAKNLIPYISKKLFLPKDYIVAEKASGDVPSRIAKPTNIKDTELILDIGPETINFYKDFIKKARTIIWNGPMGLFEIMKYAAGSYEIARALASSSAKTIIGGGETLDIIKSLGLKDRVYFVSTGGGAMLEFLGGKKLPGIEALQNK